MKRRMWNAGLLALALVSGCAGQPAEKTRGSSERREVEITVTDRGFEPALSRVPAGKPVTLVVTRKTDQTCATEIVIPMLHRRVALPLNQTVRVDIPGGIADTLGYECGMGMITGTIVAQ